MVSSEVLLAFIGDNAFQVDAAQAEAAAREKYPLLFHPNETVEMAFKAGGGIGRDKSYLTTHRLLIKDGKGIGSKRKNYLSIPYDTIQAFSIQSAGMWDGDIELKVWTAGSFTHRIDFAKGQLDLFAIQAYMNSKIFPSPTMSGDEISMSFRAGKVGSLEGMFNFFGGDAVQLIPDDVDVQLHSATPVLMPDEKVDMAFKAGRDTTVFTNRRVLMIDVKGITGKRVEFFSLKWSSISAFSVETVGQYFDRDAEFVLHLNMTTMKYVCQDLRHGKADLFAIQKYLCNKCLGPDTDPLPDINYHQGHIDQGGLWTWGGDNGRPLDAAEMDRMYHTSPPILQGCEKVEFAFKGRRDVVLFTTKRIISIDFQGLSGKKVQWTSVPWICVLGFTVETAGKYLDNDSECGFYTDMYTLVEGSGDDAHEVPAMSYIKFDFNKNMVDIFALKRYLSHRCMGAPPTVSISNAGFQASIKDEGVEKLFTKLGGDHRAVDPKEIDGDLHTTLPILLDAENVVMAFKAARDLTVFTNMRVLVIDTKGLSGQKKEVTSIPYSSIREFSTTSAGDWDRDSEVSISTRNAWSLGTTSLDFRKGKSDIVTIQKFLAAMVMENHEDAKEFLKSKSGSAIQIANPVSLKSFNAWLTANSVEIDAGDVDQKLHSEPPVLLSDEKCLKAYRSGRDLYVYTNYRRLHVDVQGIQGKRVRYGSVPWKHVKALEIETAGNFDRDAEVYIHTEITRKSQDILVKRGDIYEAHSILSELLIFGGQKK